jgi:prevent-host-death family protein
VREAGGGAQRCDEGRGVTAKNSYEVSAGEFKAHCLRLMEKVRATRRPIVITKRGEPVARLMPIEEGTRTTRSSAA